MKLEVILIKKIIFMTFDFIIMKLDIIFIKLDFIFMNIFPFNEISFHSEHVFHSHVFLIQRIFFLSKA